jgi:replicative DNA helicase
LKSAAETWSEIVKGENRGALCGLKAVDSIIQGFRPGKLIVLAARPGVGKSALALQIARQINRPVLIQSLEMLAEENAERLVSQITEGVDSYALRDAEQLIRHKASLSLAVTEISRLPVFISDRATKTPQQMMADARRIKRNHGLDLMIVDYLQLCESSERESNRSLEVGKVSKYLKRIANDLGITVIAVSSLSRKCEDREDKRPIKSDLRESGDIEHDADAILMLYRESDYNKAAEDDPRIKPVTEFIWRKNRGGRIGRELATYDGPRLRFYDMPPDSESAYRGFMKSKEPGNVW